jgi:NRAMP (natural resistance-associated macrophage protein)-like metal ion transporter
MADDTTGDAPPAPRRPFLATLGPGLVTGAADDDPSGIGTYSQVGAQFGFGLAWTLLFSLPLMIVIQEIAAQIGRVTGAGIARNLRRHYPRPLLLGIVVLLLIANVVNLGADLSAMGSALKLLIGGPASLYTFGFGIVCVVLEVAISYSRYASLLKWTTLSLFAYVGVVIVAGVDWPRALEAVIVPHIQWNAAYATGLVAILGTTISPYLFFWQSGQEVEEERHRHVKPLCITPKTAGAELARIRIDTIVGMTFSNFVAISIVFATAATLYAHGVHDIATASQAAEALRPLAGEFAFALFAVGIVGTGMLAVPVLAGSVAYAVTEMVGLTGSLDAKLLDARLFYAVIAVTTLAGTSLDILGIDAVKALYWAAVVNGILAAPLMVVMMLIVRNPCAMGRLTLGGGATIMGWAATLVMLAATGLFFFYAI